MNTDALQEKFVGPSNFWWIRWITRVSLKYRIKNGKAYKMKRCTFGNGFLIHSSRQMCHCGTDTRSLRREGWAHGYNVYISHITWGLCRETQRTTKFFCWLYKPDGESSMTATVEWEFFCELMYICICISNGYSKQKWLFQDGKIYRESLRGP